MMPQRRIFVINLILSIIFVLAHVVPIIVGALLDVKELEQEDVLWWAIPMSLLDLTMLVTSLYVLIRRSHQQTILKVHALILVVYALGIVGLLLYVLLFDFPGRFAWSPGLGAAFCSYAVYVWRRAFSVPRGKPLGNYHWYVAGTVAVGELALMVKFINMLWQMWEGNVPGKP